jgi:peptidoglycan/LPS O-acetylase OafA/YrhL
MSLSRPNRYMPFRPDIDGLRALAVALVVAFHCGISAASGGFVGVDIFFVLSGYLITSILVVEQRETGRIDFAAFYARRVRRLLPASALMLLVTLVLCAAVMAPSELRAAARAGRATSLYLANYFFSLNAADYFSSDVKGNPLLHMWSLAVEEQFYLFWPLLIFAGGKLVGRAHSSRAAITWILATVTAASLALCVITTSRTTIDAFYGLPTRAWEFGLGGLAALIYADGSAVRGRLWQVLGAIGFIGLLLSGVMIPVNGDFPGWLALFPVISTVMVLVSAQALPSNPVARLLATRPFRWLGTLSYSWYLWHWPFLVLYAVVVAEPTVTGRVGAAMLALAVAAAAYRWVENPVRFHPQLAKSGSAVPSLVMGVMLLAVGFGAAHLTQRYAEHLEQLPTLRVYTEAKADIADMPRERCVSLPGSTELLTCEFGDRGSATSMILFGDSHAIQWFDAMKTIADQQHVRLVTVLKSGCPAAGLAPPLPVASFRAECEPWRRQAFDRIASLKPSLVVLSSASHFVDRETAGLTTSADAWEAATRRTFARLVTSAASVLLLRDTPYPGFDIPVCLSRNQMQRGLSVRTCDFGLSGAINESARQAESRALAAFPQVAVWDPATFICSGNHCPAVADTVVTYRDDNHLTGRFARTLAPALWSVLREPLSSAASVAQGE